MKPTTLTDVIAPKIEKLESQRVTLIRYLEVETKDHDWHAIQDVASDLRDIDAKIEILKLVIGEME